VRSVAGDTRACVVYVIYVHARMRVNSPHIDHVYCCFVAALLSVWFNYQSHSNPKTTALDDMEQQQGEVKAAASPPRTGKRRAAGGKSSSSGGGSSTSHHRGGGAIPTRLTRGVAAV
jgi:hypothetical protein